MAEQIPKLPAWMEGVDYSHDGTQPADIIEEAVYDKCFKCKKDIKHKVIEAMHTTWHADCLTCKTCDKQLGPGYEKVFEVDGKPHCPECGRKAKIEFETEEDKFVKKEVKQYIDEAKAIDEHTLTTDKLYDLDGSAAAEKKVVRDVIERKK